LQKIIELNKEGELEKVGIRPFEKTDTQITVREWDSENWYVSKPIDLHFKKKTTCLELAGILCDYFTHINVCKIIKYLNAKIFLYFFIFLFIFIYDLFYY